MTLIKRGIPVPMPVFEDFLKTFDHMQGPVSILYWIKGSRSEPEGGRRPHSGELRTNLRTFKAEIDKKAYFFQKSSFF